MRLVCRQLHRAAGLSGKLFNPLPAGTATQAAF
jgi:hypothetical protein